MKWLLVYMVLISLELMLGGENRGNSERGRVPAEFLARAKRTEAEISSFDSEKAQAQDDVLLMKIWNPAIQSDLPTKDYNWSTPCKVLHSVARTGWCVHSYLPCISQFMSLLSVRRANGFYVYFLKKLII